MIQALQAEMRHENLLSGPMTPEKSLELAKLGELFQKAVLTKDQDGSHAQKNGVTRTRDQSNTTLDNYELFY
ncbi:MAG: hypothetical protein HQL79_09185 [Magnetococcales bacterium]|nr:hypothetical protein [Magnetococcales bacterium]